MKAVFICLVLFWGSLSASAASKSKEIDINYALGFDGLCKTGSWTPLSIIIDNSGPGVQGTLEVLVKQGSEFKGNIYQTSYSTPADLPSGTRKVFQLNVLIHSPLHPIIIQFRDNGRVLYSQAHDLREAAGETPLLLIVRKTISNEFLAAVPPPYRVAVCIAEYLPVDWYGYDGVSQIIIDPAVFNRLSDRQMTALEKWVSNGGYLIASGSANYGIFSDARVKHLLGVTISGLESMPVIESFNDFCGFPFIASRDFLVNVSKMENSEILLSENFIPLIFSKKQEDGLILFAGFDITHPDFLKWKGLESFWQKICLIDRKTPVPPLIPDDDQVLEKMMDHSPEMVPGIRLLIPVLALYLLLVTFFLKFFPLLWPGKKRACLWCLIIISACFSGAGIRFYMHRTDIQSAISVFRIGHNREKLVHDRYAGIYSPEMTRKTVEAASGRLPVKAVFLASRDTASRIPCNIHEKSGRQYLDISMDRWSYFYYKTSEFLDSGFRYTALIKDSNLDLTLENFTGRPVTNSLVYYRHQLYPVEDIAADATVVCRLSESVLKKDKTLSLEDKTRSINAFTKGPKDPFQTAFAGDILPGIFDAISRNDEDGADKIFLVGWLGSPKESVSNTDSGLLIWEMRPRRTDNEI